MSPFSEDCRGCFAGVIMNVAMIMSSPYHDCRVEFPLSDTFLALSGTWIMNSVSVLRYRLS